MENEKLVGGCHCGKVTYEANVTAEGGIECNCSHCSSKGLILKFIPASDFTQLTDADNLATYHFNKHVINHLFCRSCGVESFGTGKGPDGSETVAINLRCLKGVNVSSLNPTPYNGKSL